MDKIEALQALGSAGYTAILSEQGANAIGEPFDVKFKAVHFEPDGSPTGVMNACDGVPTTAILDAVAGKVGVSYSSASFGRGRNFRNTLADVFEKVRSE